MLLSWSKCCWPCTNRCCSLYCPYCGRNYYLRIDPYAVPPQPVLIPVPKYIPVYVPVVRDTRKWR